MVLFAGNLLTRGGNTTPECVCRGESGGKWESDSGEEDNSSTILNTRSASLKKLHVADDEQRIDSK